MVVKSKTYYTVYLVTSKINDKRYVGCHKTKNLDDGYLGSGIRITKAVSKYGKNNFDKKILFFLNNEEKMYKTEIITIKSLKPEYNIHIGGNGGWQNASKYHLTMKQKRIEKYLVEPSNCKNCKVVLEYNKKENTFCSSKCSKRYLDSHETRTLSQETKEKISKTLKSKYEGKIKSKLCPFCDKNISLRNKSCINCKYKVNMKKQFSEDDLFMIFDLFVSGKSLRYIGRMHGVRNETIKKTILEYGLIV